MKVLSVSYPPNEAALVWQVSSSDSGSARVRISYLLGNLTKSFNYRAVAAQRREDARPLRVHAHPEPGQRVVRLDRALGRFRPPLPQADRPQRDQGDAGREVRRGAGQEDLHLRSAGPRLPRPPAEQAAGADALRAQEQQGQRPGAVPLQYGKVRIFQDDGHGGTAFIGEDWGKFTPLDDEMRLYVGVAQDVVVKRTIDKNEQRRIAGNLFDREVVVKFEIENFKDKAVTLDISENVRAIRNELYGDNGRDVQWELGKDTTFAEGPDKEKSTFEQLIFHVRSRHAARTPRPRRSSTSSTWPSRTNGDTMRIH